MLDGPGEIEPVLVAEVVREGTDAAGLVPRLEAYEAFCGELGAHPADVAVAWLLAVPGVTAPIVGPRTLGQLDASLRALDLRLDADALARLDRIWPGPGGEAPEAYAW